MGLGGGYNDIEGGIMGGNDLYPGEEAVKRFQDVRSGEITLVIVAIIVVIAIACIYGDLLGINEKIATTYRDIWEIIFPR
ncbi:MAG: hypothetical protein WC724_01500 [Candidatus Paceibacterota bacterium]|jgi:hypothetical protein